MIRNFYTEALVLSMRQAGEGHREAVLLTQDRGIIRAMVYGGGKSKLKALVAPYHSGRIWLYTDPAKSSTKITDFDVLCFRIRIRENLYKTWAAALCAELTLKAHGGDGAWFTLVKGFLDGLDLAAEEECRPGLLRFLWRCQLLMGVCPDIELCVRCGQTHPVNLKRSAGGGETAGLNTENSVLYYSPGESGFICRDCIRGEEAVIPVSYAARQFLAAVEYLPPKEARLFRIGAEELLHLKTFLFFLTKKAADGQLKSLESGSGIL